MRHLDVSDRGGWAGIAGPSLPRECVNSGGSSVSLRINVAPSSARQRVHPRRGAGLLGGEPAAAAKDEEYVAHGSKLSFRSTYCADFPLAGNGHLAKKCQPTHHQNP